MELKAIRRKPYKTTGNIVRDMIAIAELGRTMKEVAYADKRRPEDYKPYAIIAEANYLLTCFYERGHCLYEGLHGRYSGYDAAYMRWQVGALKKFIAYYERAIYGIRKK